MIGQTNRSSSRGTSSYVWYPAILTVVACLMLMYISLTVMRLGGEDGETGVLMSTPTTDSTGTWHSAHAPAVDRKGPGSIQALSVAGEGSLAAVAAGGVAAGGGAEAAAGGIPPSVAAAAGGEAAEAEGVASEATRGLPEEIAAAGGGGRVAGEDGIGESNTISGMPHQGHHDPQSALIMPASDGKRVRSNSSEQTKPNAPQAAGSNQSVGGMSELALNMTLLATGGGGDQTMERSSSLQPLFPTGATEKRGTTDRGQLLPGDPSANTIDTTSSSSTAGSPQEHSGGRTRPEDSSDGGTIDERQSLGLLRMGDPEGSSSSNNATRSSASSNGTEISMDTSTPVASAPATSTPPTNTPDSSTPIAATSETSTYVAVNTTAANITDVNTSATSTSVTVPSATSTSPGARSKRGTEDEEVEGVPPPFTLDWAALRHPKRRRKYLKQVERRMKKRPFNPLEPALPPDHACANFTYSYPPLARRPRRKRPQRFRECTVCLLPHEVAVSLQPSLDELANKEAPLMRLSYVTESTSNPRLLAGSDGEKGEERREENLEEEALFNGHQTWQQRTDSFQIKEEMTVHCGFVAGGVRSNSQFAVSPEDRQYMEGCSNIAVVTAVFGGWDPLHLPEPSNHSRTNSSAVCHVAFVDRLTLDRLREQNRLEEQDNVRMRGLWKVVLVSNLPYNGTRKAARIPKLLLHRLFPNAKYSMWLDGKLQLKQDPHSVLERFLWRGNFSFAIPRHYKIADIDHEAENIKLHGRFVNASVDTQVDTYRTEGMLPYGIQKFPIVSDVPDSALLLRAHTPLSNLLSCLWFNEVHRFTPRDQLSFAYARDKILSAVPGWRVNMFLDCEKRNVAHSWPHARHT